MNECVIECQSIVGMDSVSPPTQSGSDLTTASPFNMGRKFTSRNANKVVFGRNSLHSALGAEVKALLPEGRPAVVVLTSPSARCDTLR